MRLLCSLQGFPIVAGLIFRQRKKLPGPLVAGSPVQPLSSQDRGAGGVAQFWLGAGQQNVEEFREILALVPLVQLFHQLEGFAVESHRLRGLAAGSFQKPQLPVVPFKVPRVSRRLQEIGRQAFVDADRRLERGSRFLVLSGPSQKAAQIPIHNTDSLPIPNL